MKNKRLDKAAELLSSTNMRISEICYKTGFGDPTHFTKSFSEKFNISPSEYRNRHLN